MPGRDLVHDGGIDRQPSAQLDRATVQRQVLSSESTDNAPRWRKGERLNHLFEQSCARFGTNDAVVADDVVLTYQELDGRANQAARYLIGQGIMPGDRVGLLFDRTVENYVALLAVLKANAAYVPLDFAFPAERLRFIIADAGVKAIVSMSAFEPRLRSVDVRTFFLDGATADIDAKPRAPLAPSEVAPPADQVCYVIYTSGTTGKPKGVVIEHSSICNFVRVAAEEYGFAPRDRVYQGMSIAFDFSVEEIWVPLVAGATLVPGRPGVSLIGEELADFLRDRSVTCLCCCPTLLATIATEVPQLRVLLIGGEACPKNLVVRWHRPGRTILNSYGPTEATVTATLAELTPDTAVTIGKPLPTYAIAILDPAKDRVVAPGELGEIGIAGIGLAAGYLNLDELTRKRFITDFLDIPNNPSHRIFRTGDLGRINANGDIEYCGRIDSQVKVRGYRIEPVEIESVLLEVPQISQAAVGTYEPQPGMVELVAYYTLKHDGSELPPSELTRVLRTRLPAYMIPAFFEKVPVIPMTANNKADVKKLPKPSGARFQVRDRLVAPKTETERILALTLAQILKVNAVSTKDHFFEDLGANSLLMAHFCAQVRQHRAMSSVSMLDIYLNPTIAQLADHLGHAADTTIAAGVPEPICVPSAVAYLACGALQLLFYAGYGLLVLWIIATGLAWTYAAIVNPVELYIRSITFAAAFFVAMTAIPIGAKWLLIGKWKAQSFPIWSLRYFSFWVVKTLIRASPMAAFTGSPIYNVYLRLLGAKIGRHAVISSRWIPVCTDLFSVGDNTILRKDSILLGYTAQSNFIHIGPIQIGSDAFVGEASVLDVNTVMGNHTQLGHASSLQSGQRVPDGKHYHGSPAVETTADYCPIESRRCTSLRRGVYAALQLLGLLVIMGPITMLILNHWYRYFAQFAGNVSADLYVPTSPFAWLMLLTSAATFFGLLAIGLIGVYVVPRLCQLALKTGTTYPLYGFHYWLQGVISFASNSRLYNLLFGDSSLIVRYMQFVGWNLNKIEQTGSNFGTNQKHDNPFLCDVGSGTMVSDGISMINMHMSSSSFRLSMTRIGERNYLGNDIHYPPDGRTGANCLLATKAMIPIEGPVRENVGLLGSPCFEIPRIVERDKKVRDVFADEVRRQRLRMKNVHNFVTAALFVLTRWMFWFVTLFVLHLAVLNYPQFGVFSPFAAAAFLFVAAILYFAFIERASINFGRLKPQLVSIYEPYFWSHERHWKLSDSPIVQLFGGTPFKNTISRLLGAQIGRMVYDGGCAMTERTLAEVGDYANLNEGSILQCHSLEEGVFKSDHIRIGNGCSLGPMAFVHYGVTMGEHIVLDADSFLMKGEVLEPHTGWRGNPARIVRANMGRGSAAAS